MAEYISKYTGTQIDSLLDTVIKNKSKLDNIDENATATEVITYTANLSMDNWIDNTDYVTQTISITGILASDEPVIDISVTNLSAVGRQAVASAWCEVYYISTADGSITAEARTAPTTDIPIQIMVVR